MATPWRHPETGTYYLRRQIPGRCAASSAAVRCGSALSTWETPKRRGAPLRRSTPSSRRCSSARGAIAERDATTRLTPEAAAARVGALHRGSRAERFPTLANVYWSEEAATTFLPGASPAALTDATPEGLTMLNPDRLAGDLWMRIVRTRPRADALFMAEHMIVWVHEGFRSEAGAFGDLVRSAENDVLIMDAVTASVEHEQVELRKLLRSPLRHAATRLRPDMTLGELLAAWSGKTPVPGPQGVHETSTTVADFIDFVPPRLRHFTPPRPHGLSKGVH